MKQTVEEAAEIYTAQAEDYDFAEVRDVKRAFVDGADWQSKQSPWISVEERLPEEGQKVLVLIEYMGTIQIHEHVYWVESDWSHGYSRVLGWMPIPSFDEILEANKDVLQRMKEKETEYGSKERNNNRRNSA